MTEAMPIEKNLGEYAAWRIPGLVLTEKKTLLAYFECRRDSASDWADIDLRVIRSTDGGETWQTVRMLSGEGNTLNNPVMIVDGERVHFLFCKNYREIFHSVSLDDGVSFSAPRRLDATVKEFPGFFNALALGPGHGICHRGRLLVPMWFAYNTERPKAHHPSHLTTLYSDDRGESWHVGEVIDEGDIPDPNESALAQTASGDLFLSVRNESPAHRRAFSTSESGIDGWTPLRLVPTLTDPVCQGSLADRDGVLFHCSCASTDARKDLTVRVSRDGFDSVSSIPIDEIGGYSDIVLLDGAIGVLYERGVMTGGKGLYWRRIPYSFDEKNEV